MNASAPLGEAPRLRPGLAAISFAPEHGGVGYVARLLDAALATSFGAPWRLALEPARLDRVSSGEASRFAARLLLANARGAFDFVVFNHPGIARAQGLIPRLVRKPYVVQLHGTDVFDAPLRAAHAAVLAGAALRLAPSRFTARRTQEVNPAIGPITVCAHGLLPGEAPSADAADAQLLSRVEAQSALIVGRLWSSERRKGHDQLLEAWPLVLARVPGAQLVIAGDGDDRRRLEDKARRLGIAQHVLFAGYVSEATLAALRRVSATFVMPSQQEGFGLVYVEAMREGLPCVGATNDAAEDVIVHGETGWLVEQSDRDQLANAVALLLEDEGLRRRFGEAGRRRYVAEYTFDRYRERLTRAIGAALPAGDRASHATARDPMVAVR